MLQEQESKGELLLEARRTTHAVRAIARFVLLIVTYQVFAAIFLFLATALDAAGSSDASVGFALFGGVIAVAGLIHALVAGHSELELSKRTAPVTQPSPVVEQAELPRDENGLLEGTCSCTKWERAGATDVKNGVKYCTRCERVIPA